MALETQAAATQPEDTLADDAQWADELGDLLGAEPKADETQAAETEAAETHAAETHAAETEAVETKGAETQADADADHAKIAAFLRDCGVTDVNGISETSTPHTTGSLLGVNRTLSRKLPICKKLRKCLSQ